ncbi:MAG: hypothetical protein LQ344_001606 [Seirophora lacunosa]|nr:MAG: hypothetical protein LQ344_001606 [Seirophora lacunosa]
MDGKAPIPAQGPINLIVAVSFGLLVAPRILKLAKYGGVNIHPSILPEFRGPAPLHHTLLNNRKTTGVTLQTLHPTRFDDGKIIDQTPYPGIEHGAETVEDLRDKLAHLGADMLVQSIRNHSFLPPIQEAIKSEAFRTPAMLTYASKVGPKDRHIDWATWTASDILRRQKVIGPLWSTTEALVRDGCGQRRVLKRIIWVHGFRHVEKKCHLFPAIGHPILVGLHGSVQSVYIRTYDGNTLVADKVKIEGQPMIDASLAARRTGLVPMSMKLGALRQYAHDFVAFHTQLT